MMDKKCKVLGCNNQAIDSEESLEFYCSSDYRGYCDMHAKARNRADIQMHIQEQLEKEQQENDENL